MLSKRHRIHDLVDTFKTLSETGQTKEAQLRIFTESGDRFFRTDDPLHHFALDVLQCFPETKTGGPANDFQFAVIAIVDSLLNPTLFSENPSHGHSTFEQNRVVLFGRSYKIRYVVNVCRIASQISGYQTLPLREVLGVFNKDFKHNPGFFGINDCYCPGIGSADTWMDRIIASISLIEDMSKMTLEKTHRGFIHSPFPSSAVSYLPIADGTRVPRFHTNNTHGGFYTKKGSTHTFIGNSKQRDKSEEYLLQKKMEFTRNMNRYPLLLEYYTEMLQFLGVFEDVTRFVETLHGEISSVDTTTISKFLFEKTGEKSDISISVHWKLGQCDLLGFWECMHLFVDDILHSDKVGKDTLSLLGNNVNRVLAYVCIRRIIAQDLNLDSFLRNDEGDLLDKDNKTIRVFEQIYGFESDLQSVPPLFVAARNFVLQCFMDKHNRYRPFYKTENAIRISQKGNEQIGKAIKQFQPFRLEEKFYLMRVLCVIRHICKKVILALLHPQGTNIAKQSVIAILLGDKWMLKKLSIVKPAMIKYVLNTVVPELYDNYFLGIGEQEVIDRFQGRWVLFAACLGILHAFKDSFAGEDKSYFEHRNFTIDAVFTAVGKFGRHTFENSSYVFAGVVDRWYAFMTLPTKTIIGARLW